MQYFRLSDSSSIGQQRPPQREGNTLTLRLRIHESEPGPQPMPSTTRVGSKQLHRRNARTKRHPTRILQPQDVTDVRQRATSQDCSNIQALLGKNARGRATSPQPWVANSGHKDSSPSPERFTTKCLSHGPEYPVARRHLHTLLVPVFARGGNFVSLPGPMRTVRTL